jgi:tRNA-modifying protein YgfZ
VIFMNRLTTYQLAAGGVADDCFPSIPASFGNDIAALAAVENGVAVVDRSHWSRIVVGGEERLRFLHNQSTADFLASKPGDCLDTVFVNSTGRTIDLATALILEQEVLLLFSPAKGAAMMELMDRYIFPADRVELRDVSATMATFSTIGPESDRLIMQLGGSVTTTGHQVLSLEGTEVRVAVGNGLGLPGHTWFIETAAAAKLWQKLLEMGALPMGDRLWENLRILQGRPAADRELTSDYNPLEVGLWQTISFSKGCYIGQETIARLNTYKGVKQYLWGIELPQEVPIGSELSLVGEKVGVLTSCTSGMEPVRGLVYLKSKVGGVGLKVQVAGVAGEILALPFVSHEYPS